MTVRMKSPKFAFFSTFWWRGTISNLIPLMLPMKKRSTTNRAPKKWSVWPSWPNFRDDLVFDPPVLHRFARWKIAFSSVQQCNWWWNSRRRNFWTENSSQKISQIVQLALVLEVSFPTVQTQEWPLFAIIMVLLHLKLLSFFSGLQSINTCAHVLSLASRSSGRSHCSNMVLFWATTMAATLRVFIRVRKTFVFIWGEPASHFSRARWEREQNTYAIWWMCIKISSSSFYTHTTQHATCIEEKYSQREMIVNAYKLHSIDPQASKSSELHVGNWSRKGSFKKIVPLN